jgi:N-acyl-D-aspartate/D-glutamate deacylase
MRLTFASGTVLNIVPYWGPILALPHEERKAALRDPAVRDRMREGLAGLPVNNLSKLFEWSRFRIGETVAPINAKYSERYVGEIAASEGKDPVDALIDIALADDLLTKLWPGAPGDDEESWQYRKELWLDNRIVFGGGDAGAHLDMTQSWRYFTTLLGLQVRERNLLTLEEAVRLITDRPARLFGLRNRGQLSVGAAADIVVFDAARVGATTATTRRDLPADAERIWSQGQGIEHVFVNGVEIVEGDKLTGARGGVVLRSGRETDTVTPAQFPSGASPT